MDTMFTAALPLLGVIVGALLQHVSSKSSEAHRQLATARNSSYVDYLKCVAESATTRRRDGEFMARLADAKARLAVHGTCDVLAALASFEREYPVIDSHSAAKRFLEVVKGRPSVETALGEGPVQHQTRIWN